MLSHTAPDDGDVLYFEDKLMREDSFCLCDAQTTTSIEEMQNSLLEKYCPGDGVGAGCLSLLTAAVSPTMLALPLAFSLAGTHFSLACMAFCIMMTFFSVRILAYASASASSDDYEAVTGFFLGAKGKWIARFILLAYNFGCGVVYLCLVKDIAISIVRSKGANILPTWLQGTVGGLIVFALFLGCLTPFTFNARLASLRTNGLVSNALTTFIIGAVIYRYLFPLESFRDSVVRPPNPTRVRHVGLELMVPYLLAAPIFIFSYEVQSNVMSVIKDLRDRTGRRLLVCLSVALAIATIFYVLLGMFGSLSFPTLSEGNILALYNTKEDPLMLLCQLFCCYGAGVSFVFSMFPCRQAVFMFISDGTSSKVSRRNRANIGTVLSVTAGFCAIVLPGVVTVVSLLGALFSTTISLTLPAVFALKMRWGGTYLTSTFDACISWILLVLGVFFSTSGTAFAFFDTFGYGSYVR